MDRFIWKLKIWSGKLFRLMLRFFFQFEKWHVFTLTERKYARDIIKYCDSIENRNSVVEIGCGLGDILRKLKYALDMGLIAIKMY